MSTIYIPTRYDGQTGPHCPSMTSAALWVISQPDRDEWQVRLTSSFASVQVSEDCARGRCESAEQEFLLRGRG